MPVVSTDAKDIKLHVPISMLIAPGITCHIYAVVDASTREVVTHLVENKSRLRGGNVIIRQKHEGETKGCTSYSWNEISQSLMKTVMAEIVLRLGELLGLLLLSLTSAG